MSFNELGAYVTYRSEDVGRIDYTVTHYASGGYAITAYSESIGNTATYHGKGNVWKRVEGRGYKASMVLDGRIVWRLAELALELEESEKAS